MVHFTANFTCTVTCNQLHGTYVAFNVQSGDDFCCFTFCLEDSFTRTDFGEYSHRPLLTFVLSHSCKPICYSTMWSVIWYMYLHMVAHVCMYVDIVLMYYVMHHELFLCVSNLLCFIYMCIDLFMKTDSRTSILHGLRD